ncbi:ROK family protein [Oceanobacillus sojae]|uniref:ROK family protein n=1 Tax=Oceanobacillus sojae TaxID=582851 RepID=UPI0021A8FCBF|nr:ROK family protein [Oceanobacillus sojae]MCT1902104.1 ROK family protein [Oceanobacillus sojae]
MIGVDIGGTKIASIVADSVGNIVHRCELPSIKEKPEEMFQQVIRCIHQLILSADVSMQEVTSMGVGVPGKIDREKGLAVFQNNLPWRNFPIVERLKEQFPSIKNITIDNDVYMAAYAEWKAAELPENATFVYVTVSTGISCSIIHNGNFLRGNGFAGELGLLPMPGIDQTQTSTTLENIASGPGILRLARDIYNDPDLEIETLFFKYQKNEKQAVKVINQMLESLAGGLYTIACLINPHQIVCGGGVINHQPYLVDLLNKLVDNFMILEQGRTNSLIKVSKLGEDAGVIGASRNALENVSVLK